MEPGATAGMYACSTCRPSIAALKLKVCGWTRRAFGLSRRNVRLLHLQTFHCSLEIGDVRLEECLAGVLQRPDALINVTRAAETMPVVILRKVAAIATGNRRIVNLRRGLEAAQSRGDVVAERGLALLPVVDAVDADVHLPAHHLGHRCREPSSERIRVV